MDPMIQAQVKDWVALTAGVGLVGWCIYIGATTLRRRQQIERPVMIMRLLTTVVCVVASSALVLANWRGVSDLDGA